MSVVGRAPTGRGRGVVVVVLLGAPDVPARAASGRCLRFGVDAGAGLRCACWDVLLRFLVDVLTLLVVVTFASCVLLKSETIQS